MENLSEDLGEEVISQLKELIRLLEGKYGREITSFTIRRMDDGNE